MTIAAHKYDPSADRWTCRTCVETLGAGHHLPEPDCKTCAGQGVIRGGAALCPAPDCIDGRRIARTAPAPKAGKRVAGKRGS